MEVSPIAGLQRVVKHPELKRIVVCEWRFPRLRDCNPAQQVLALLALALSVNGGFPDCGIATSLAITCPCLPGSVNGGFPDCGIATFRTGTCPYFSALMCEWRFPRLRDCNLRNLQSQGLIEIRVNGGFPDCGIATLETRQYFP